MKIASGAQIKKTRDCLLENIKIAPACLLYSLQITPPLMQPKLFFKCIILKISKQLHTYNRKINLAVKKYVKKRLHSGLVDYHAFMLD